MSVRGPEKTGKTRLAFTGPEPIAVIDIDKNCEAEYNKWKDKKACAIFPIRIPPIFNQKNSMKIWEDVQAKTLELLKLDDSDLRTIMVDNCSDLWEYVRMGVLGATQGVVPTKYSEANTPYHQWLQQFKEYRKNVLLVHRNQEIYKGVGSVREATGKYKLEGYKHTTAVTQVNLVSSFVDGDFKMTVESCNQNHLITGMELTNDEITWQMLGCSVYEGTTEEDWE